MNSAGEPNAIPESPPLIMKNEVKTQDDCVRELGYAWIYMHYLQPGWLEPHNGYDSAKKQKKRVKSLMMKCAVNWHTRVPQFWEYFYQEIMDEIENMC